MWSRESFEERTISDLESPSNFQVKEKKLLKLVKKQRYYALIKNAKIVIFKMDARTSLVVGVKSPVSVEGLERAYNLLSLKLKVSGGRVTCWSTICIWGSSMQIYRISIYIPLIFNLLLFLFTTFFIWLTGLLYNGDCPDIIYHWDCKVLMLLRSF